MDKKHLNAAFAELRKQGYFARQNFLCCQTCAWAEVPDTNAEKAVFYHAQDNSVLKSKGSCYVTWAGNAKEIISIFNSHGVKTDWDGSENTRIRISI